MLTDKELDNLVAADRKEATAEPFIVVGFDCAQGTDDPARPKG
ncbi:hypothetical protein [Methylobacterium platani]|nr:hypothetical protein [Methylobacterium platani]